MLLKKSDGTSIYFEYMLEIQLDDKSIYLATGDIEGKVITAQITIPNSISKSIDPVECSGSVGSLNCSVYNDNDCTFSKLLAEYDKGSGFYYRKCKLFLVTATEETLMYTGLLRNIKGNDEYETMYNLEIADVMSELFKKPTLLYDDEKKYKNWFDTNLANKPSDLYGIIVTKYLNSDNKPEIKLKGHPLNVAKFLIKNMQKDNVTFNTQTFDIAILDTYQTILEKCEFKFTQSIDDTIGYIVKNIFRICNTYPYLNESGELCVKMQKPLTVLDDITYRFVTKDNIIGKPRKSNDFSKVVNQLVVIRGENGNIKDYYFDGDSYDSFKKLLPEKPKEITLNYGTMTTEEIQVIGKDMSMNLFVMFAYSYNLISLETELTDFSQINVADIIGINHDLIIDSSTGERGISDNESLDTFLYCRMDLDYWGGYLPTYKDLKYYDENNQELSYNVTEKVTTVWYNSVIDANSKNYGKILYRKE